jgi:hypothetical protein
MSLESQLKTGFWKWVCWLLKDTDLGSSACASHHQLPIKKTANYMFDVCPIVSTIHWCQRL